MYALTAFDDGSGPALYAAGDFGGHGHPPPRGVAKWDGKQWSAVGEGLLPYPEVHALAVFDDGRGPMLYAGGLFRFEATGDVLSCARWDGATWQEVGDHLNHFVNALTVWDDGHGPALYAAGKFTSAGAVGAHRVAKWDGQRWSALGQGHGASDSIAALHAYDRLGGPALYAGGDFGAAGTVGAQGVARWDGSAWSAMPGCPADWPRMYAVCGFDDGHGPAVFAGGDIRNKPWTLGGLARWDGGAWSIPGGGVGWWGHPEYGLVHAMAPFDDGGGPALYVGGYFGLAGEVIANHVAKWDGTHWWPLGSGMKAVLPWNMRVVCALAVFDDGGGPALYAGGGFVEAGGLPALHIAKWDGLGWSEVGGGVSHKKDSPSVAALVVFDDGTGPALYAAGRFDTAGTVPAANIARWDGRRWSALGAGVYWSAPGSSSWVYALAAFDDGTGPGLYAGGWFNAAGGAPALFIAKWNGSRWSPLGNGVDGPVSALEVFEDADGPALYVGGRFLIAGGRVSANIARWGPLAGMKYGDLNCDGLVNRDDVDPFVLALWGEPAYLVTHPDCNWLSADCNRDGWVDFNDIDPFVELLGGSD